VPLPLLLLLLKWTPTIEPVLAERLRVSLPLLLLPLPRCSRSPSLKLRDSCGLCPALLAPSELAAAAAAVPVTAGVVSF
jgi:hypothetical protein